MSEAYQHTCIKCKKMYQDSDPDPYYCTECVSEKKAIAEKVDATIAARPRKQVKSALQEYDEAPKVYGRFIQVRL